MQPLILGKHGWGIGAERMHKDTEGHRTCSCSSPFTTIILCQLPLLVQLHCSTEWQTCIFDVHHRINCIVHMTKWLGIKPTEMGEQTTLYNQRHEWTLHACVSMHYTCNVVSFIMQCLNRLRMVQFKTMYSYPPPPLFLQAHIQFCAIVLGRWTC